VAAGITILVAVWFGSIEYMNMKYADYGTPFVSLVSAVVIFLGVLFIAEAITKISLIVKPLAYMGMASLVIKYVHMGIIYGMLALYSPSKLEIECGVIRRGTNTIRSGIQIPDDVHPDAG